MVTAPAPASVRKIEENDPDLTDEEALEAWRITNGQEWAIERILQEVGRSNGALLADDMGVGKTVQGVEVALRGGFERVLFIALPNTHLGWAARITAQSDGRVTARIMDGSESGRAALKAFRAGEKGFFIAGPHYLMAQDYRSVRVVNPAYRPDQSRREDGTVEAPFVFKRYRTTNVRKGAVRGELELRARKEGVIGPDAEPIIATESERIKFFDYYLKKYPLDAVIADEVHVFAANKFNQMRRTIRAIIRDERTFKLFMSGTWFLNDPDNMWSPSRLVWPGINPATGRNYVDSNHDIWRDRFMVREVVTRTDGTAMTTSSGREIKKTAGERVEGGFIATLPCYIRREAADPIPEPEYIFVDPTPEQRMQQEDLEADLLTWVMMQDGTEEPLVVNLPPELYVRLRQLTIAALSLDENGDVYFAEDAACAKLTPIHGLISQVWKDLPVAIYTDSKIGAKFIAERMRRAGYDAREWTGDTTKPARRALQAAFQAGEFKYLVATVQSMGTGVDGLQTVCDKVIWVTEVDGDPATNAQGIRRFLRPHRIKRDGRDEFMHVRLMMRDSADIGSVQNLIHKQYLIARSIRLRQNEGVMA
jgi:hypothetical protein